MDEFRGLHPLNWPQRGQLAAPVGVVDRPFEQRRDPLMVSLDGAGGNVVIVGGPQSGKSTMLRSLVCVARAHPHAVGGAVLLPGLRRRRAAGAGGAAARVRGGRPARRRAGPPDGGRGDRRCWTSGRPGSPSSASTRSPRYRRLRATHEVADDPFGDVFLVVDGWATLRQDYEELEQPITNLATRGLGYGIHVIITAARWAEVRIGLRDSIGTKLELRLGDPAESEIDRRAAVNVPERYARAAGITQEKLHFLAAVSRSDGRPTVDQAGRGDGRPGRPDRRAPGRTRSPRRCGCCRAT